MKERIFEHSKFNSAINSGYVARDIVRASERGSATAEKIATVLNHIHETEKISVLNRISSEVIENYKSYLSQAVSSKELSPHTAQTYGAALNSIIQYINLRTDKNLSAISVSKDLGIQNAMQYGGKSTSQDLFDKVRSKISEANQIKIELQRNLFLRVRESHQIKKTTIENALKSGTLSLNNKSNDGTKNSRPRDVVIRTEAQKATLARALSYMNRTGQRSMIENSKTWKQAQSKYYRDMRIAGFTKAANNGFNPSHGNRHAGINALSETLQAQGLNFKESDRIVSSELGHGEERTTSIYVGKH